MVTSPPEAEASIPIPLVPVADTSSDAEIETLPVPVAATLIPVVVPMTVAAEMVTSPPAARASIPIPPCVVPATLIETAPELLLLAHTPVSPPCTVLVAVMLTVPPLAWRMVAYIPCSEVPSTDPVAVMLTDPCPAISASIPLFPPVTLAASIVTDLVVLELPTKASMPKPSAWLAVTSPLALMLMSPVEPMALTMMPRLAPVADSAEMAMFPTAESDACSTFMPYALVA